MDDLNRYLDLYRVGDAVQRSVSPSRAANAGLVGPEDRFFNVPFPMMRTGLTGLGVAPGEPLVNPDARLYESTGALVPNTTWLQRAINTLLPVGERLTVDGAAGPLTLRATYDAWQRWAALPGAATARELAQRQDPASRPYAPRMTPTGVAIERAFLNFLVGRIAVPDPTPATPPRPPAPRTEPEPPPATSGGGLFLLAAVIAAGAYFSSR
jgi:hypothetical protein